MVRGGGGADKIYVRDGDGDDVVECGAGRDVVKADSKDNVDPRCERVRDE